MFNDERINLEMGKLKKIIILVSVIIAFLFYIKKMVYYMNTKSYIFMYLTESAIMVSGLIILLIPLFKKVEVKDELYYQAKANYYNKTFKIFLLIVFSAFAISIPGTLFIDTKELSSNITISLLLNASLFIGYGYLRFKNVYFNYNIIENDTKEYYKQVFKNILKLLLYCCLIYALAFIPAIFYFQYVSPLGLILSIILGCVFTFLNNALFYLGVSALERLFCKEENKKIITTPTIILLILTLILYFVVVILGYIYLSMINGDISAIELELIRMDNVINYISHLTKLLGVMATIFSLSDLTKNNFELKKKIFIPLIIFIILKLYNLCYLYINFGDLLFYLTRSYEINIIPLGEIYVIQMYTNLIINLVLQILIIIFSWIALKHYVKSRKKLSITCIILLLLIIVIHSFIISVIYTLQILSSILSLVLVSIFSLIPIIKYFKKTNLIKEEDELLDNN